MDLELIFLGTAGAVPTVDRGTSSVLIIRGGERLLIDCGEGTQRQLMRSAGLARINKVFLTHLHGDHYLGLPGFLKTLSLTGRTEPFTIYGPPGLARLFTEAQRVFGRHLFPVSIVEVLPGEEVPASGYRMLTCATDHGVPSLAWCLEEEKRPGRFHPERALALSVPAGPAFHELQLGRSVVSERGVLVAPSEVMDEPRPGRRIVITGDTRPCGAVAHLARQATVLVHDSTFASSEQDRALATNHSTAREAAAVARAAGVSLLVLTHISSRHSPRELLEEGQAIFPRTMLPRDLERLVVPFPDKGDPYITGRACGQAMRV